MTTAKAPDQEAAGPRDGSLNLSIPMFGRQVGFTLQWRRGRGLRRLAWAFGLMQLVFVPINFWLWSVVLHSTVFSASVTAGDMALTLAVGIFIAELSHRRNWVERTSACWSAFSSRGLTDLAAFLAGRKRPGLRQEWRTHLAGESGHDPATWAKVKDALGFIISAIRLRLADAADAAWIPADALLKSRKLSNLLVFGPTAAAAMFILRHLGTLGVLISAESISAIGFGLYALIRVGRWWRNVKPLEPKARRVNE